jgi:hypothetical protein
MLTNVPDMWVPHAEKHITVTLKHDPLLQHGGDVDSPSGQNWHCSSLPHRSSFGVRYAMSRRVSNIETAAPALTSLCRRNDGD